jgi:hypothetical protein
MISTTRGRAAQCSRAPNESRSLMEGGKVAVQLHVPCHTSSQEYLSRLRPLDTLVALLQRDPAIAVTIPPCPFVRPHLLSNLTKEGLPPCAAHPSPSLGTGCLRNLGRVLSERPQWSRSTPNPPRSAFSLDLKSLFRPLHEDGGN